MLLIQELEGIFLSKMKVILVRSIFNHPQSHSSLNISSLIHIMEKMPLLISLVGNDVKVMCISKEIYHIVFKHIMMTCTLAKKKFMILICSIHFPNWLKKTKRATFVGLFFSMTFIFKGWIPLCVNKTIDHVSSFSRYSQDRNFTQRLH